MVGVNLDFQRRAACRGISQLRNRFFCDTLSGFVDTEFLDDVFIEHFMACSYVCFLVELTRSCQMHEVQ
jgi:hypothetical protein